MIFTSWSQLVTLRHNIKIVHICCALAIKFLDPLLILVSANLFQFYTSLSMCRSTEVTVFFFSHPVDNNSFVMHLSLPFPCENILTLFTIKQWLVSSWWFITDHKFNLNVNPPSISVWPKHKNSIVSSDQTPKSHHFKWTHVQLYYKIELVIGKE